MNNKTNGKPEAGFCSTIRQMLLLNILKTHRAKKEKDRSFKWMAKSVWAKKKTEEESKKNMKRWTMNFIKTWEYKIYIYNTIYTYTAAQMQ